jgi:hypothetical protein
MFAMLFTLFVAILAATLWALRSFYFDAGGGSIPHDPSTLELAIMAAITVATYRWMQRLRAIRQQTATKVSEMMPAPPVPVRYAEAKIEAATEESLEEAEQVA